MRDDNLSMMDEGFAWSDGTWRNGSCIYVRKWSLESNGKPRGIVLIAHGMGEHIGRYESFAKKLTEHGYVVYGSDFLGHGRTHMDCNSTGHVRGYLGVDGFHGMVQSLQQVHKLAAKAYPRTPIILFGHSMGSFAVHAFVEDYGSGVDGVILSGSAGKQNPLINLGILLASITASRWGEQAESPLIERLMFGPYNRRIRPRLSKRDWLSRDAVEVQSFLNDSLCNFILTAGSLRDLYHGLKEIHRKEKMSKIPKDLPFLLVSGRECPLGNYGRGIRSLAKSLRKQSIQDIEVKLYPGARHELLHEVNRDEVYEDILRWLDVHTAVNRRSLPHGYRFNS